MATKGKRIKKAITQEEGIRNTRVLVEFIQDRSGSMSAAWDETRNGFKVFVEDLKANGKKDNIDYFLSLTLFDDRLDRPYVQKAIDKVNTDILNLPEFRPRGYTALNDAVVAAVTGERGQFDKIICIIVTDGQENASMATKESVHKLVDERLNSGNWTFQYLGAQPETWDDAKKLGISVAGSTLRYDVGNAGQTYHFMSQSLNNFSKSSALGTTNLRQYDAAPTATVAGLTTEEEERMAADNRAINNVIDTIIKNPAE